MGIDLATGSIGKHFIKLAIPTFIGYLLYTGYGIINTIWVGNLIGDDAVGATAVSFVIIYVLISIATGATTASSVLVSQYYGAKNYNMVNKIVGNSYVISAIIDLIITLLGLIFCNPLLKIMNTPIEIFNLASEYLKISLIGFAFLYFFILVMALLRGIGDTMTPIVFLGASTLLNAILDPILIAGVGPFPKMGLNGAAYASLISQIFALIIGFVYIHRKNSYVAPSFGKFNIEKGLTSLTLKIGFPSILQQVLVALGIVFVATFVNGFGASTTTAYGVVMRIDTIVNIIAMALGTAASAITGQCIGANRHDKIKDIFKWGIIIAFIFAAVITIAVNIFPKAILRIFVSSSDVINIGISYIRIVSIGYFLLIAMFVINGIFNGARRTLVPMLISLSTLWLIRIPVSEILSHTGLRYNGIWIAITISNLIGLGSCLLCYAKTKWDEDSLKIIQPTLKIDRESAN